MSCYHAAQLAAHLLLFLFLCCLSGCSAHRHMFDQPAAAGMGSPSIIAAAREVQVGEHGAGQKYTVLGDDYWVPICIRVSAEDLQDTSRYCTKVGGERPNFRGDLVMCKAEDIITVEKKNVLLQKMLPAAIKLHSDRLSVKPLWKPRVSIPHTGHCSEFLIPESHRTDGVLDADFVLYVASGPGHSFAEVCTEDDKDWRPIASVLQIEPARVGDGRYHIRIAAHEIAHALGFDFKRMQRLGMISFVPHLGKTNGIWIVHSQETLKAARTHYNCSTLLGMELEDEADSSHWKRRNAKDELMSTYVDSTGGAYYTTLTLAAFADMKFYRVDLSMAEPMGWGKNAGCDFLEKKCIENNVTAFPEMFCTEKSTALQCTSDRYALGTCALERYTMFRPDAYKYFGEAKVGGPASLLTDYCPVITPTAETTCSSGNAGKMPGSRVGRMSRCLNGKGIALRTPSTAALPARDVCANVKCVENAVQVQYSGDDTWHACPTGAELSLAGPVFSGGSIVCPKYEEVCVKIQTPAALPLRCLGGIDGDYINGRCCVKEADSNESDSRGGVNPSETTGPTHVNGAFVPLTLWVLYMLIVMVTVMVFSF